MSITQRTARAAVLIAISIAIAACGTDSPEDSTPSSTSVASSIESSLPNTPVGSEVAWVLESLAADAGPTAAEAEVRFSNDFLAQVPADQISGTLDQLRPIAPFAVDGYDATETGAEVSLVAADESQWRMVIDLADDGKIAVLAIQPHQEAPDITGWEELHTALAETGARVHLHAARQDGDGWKTLYESDADDPAPLGSVFKLYVLGAVQQAVLDGQVSWSDRLTITDQVRSLPTGELQELPAGTEVTVAEAATKMISISDNTATDMLIDLVGRDSVEAAVSEMGHQDPESMQPLLTTKELFRVGWTGSELRARYADADETGRRQILSELPESPLEMEEVNVAGPAWPDGVDWFATAADVSRAHASLQAMASEDPSSTVRTLMSLNHGADIDTATWPYVAFKGGSAPGLIAGSWYLESADGTPHILVVQLAAEDALATADVAYVSDVAAQGTRLLGSSG